jgi:hypothetical protein
MADTERIDALSHDEQVYAIKTWRYLRLAMVVLVVGIGVSIGFEHWKTDPACFQTSISAYYYTPVQGYFVGALVAIGACLICLKGNTEVEDILLNLAGMFAPVVALVPTPNTGSCASVLGTTEDRNVNISNNMFTLLVVGLIGLALVAWLMVRSLRSDDKPATTSIIGFGVAVVLWLATVLVFAFARDLFVKKAHYTAAILLFVCILAVVVINALGYKEKTGAAAPRNGYAAIALAMVLAALVVGLAGFLGWDYWVLAIEASLITLFAVFWATQTRELWHDGLR